ncbi:hypothetical protein CFOL_v3_19673 [Cephalotus follicularis]|uniref:Putative plant transposon protein domain-containing protein n=1 Tax=Cephalotus follicularis TaxID=3775 RepID=A0A1Q3C7Z2_CEPFO|nr:hypothetical protein CFOL_v3_19673 [Cephalotus follicularis]
MLVGKTLDFDFYLREGFSIVGWLNALGLRPLFNVNLPHYPDLMKEFYANFGFNTSVSLSPRVKNKNILMNYPTLASILSITCDGSRGWSNRSWVEEDGFNKEECVHLLFGENAHVVKKMYSHNLRFDYRFLHRAVSTHILPKASGFDEVTRMEAFTMFHIITGRRINVPLLILNHMKAIQARENARLPYGNLVTYILMDYHVDLDGEVPHALQSADKLGKGTLSRMGFKKHKRLRTWIPKNEDSNRVGNEKEEEEQEEEAQGGENVVPEDEHSHSFNLPNCQFEEIMQAIRGLEKGQRSLERGQRSLKGDQRNLERRQRRLQRNFVEKCLIGNEDMTTEEEDKENATNDAEDQNTETADIGDDGDNGDNGMDD